MKFGEHIHAEAVRSGHPEQYLAYNTIKRLVKDEDIPAVQEHLHKEMEKVDAVFRQEEFECSRIFNELQKEGWNCAAVRESSVDALQSRIHQLVAFGQWNYTAVEKITKKIRRRLGQGILPDTTATMLSRWYPYCSMEPARMLAMLRDVPTRPDSSHASQRSAAASSRRVSETSAPVPATAAATASTSRHGVRRRRTRGSDQRAADVEDGSRSTAGAGRLQAVQLTSEDEEEPGEEGYHREVDGTHTPRDAHERGDNQSNATTEDSSSAEEGSDEEASANGCPVCLTTRMEEPALCSCAHRFCFNCIRQTKTCPVCRKRHFSTFIMAGSGEIVTPNADSAHDGHTSLWWIVLRRVRDIVWYLLVLALLLPFLAALFTLGFLWSGIVELIDLVRGKQTVYPVPLSYKKFPLIAPHGLTTAPPPWSQPSLWE